MAEGPRPDSPLLEHDDTPRPWSWVHERALLSGRLGSVRSAVGRRPVHAAVSVERPLGDVWEQWSTDGASVPARGAGHRHGRDRALLTTRIPPFFSPDGGDPVIAGQLAFGSVVFRLAARIVRPSVMD